MKNVSHDRRRPEVPYSTGMIRDAFVLALADEIRPRVPPGCAVVAEITDCELVRHAGVRWVPPGRNPGIIISDPGEKRLGVNIWAAEDQIYLYLDPSGPDDDREEWLSLRQRPDSNSDSTFAVAAYYFRYEDPGCIDELLSRLWAWLWPRQCDAWELQEQFAGMGDRGRHRRHRRSMIWPSTATRLASRLVSHARR